MQNPAALTPLVTRTTREHERAVAESHAETAEHIAGGLWSWVALVVAEVEATGA
jgi:hypothetical protein